jgi:DNA-binding transcriptional ArsR family regulator
LTGVSICHIVYQMVHYREERLNRIFSVLSDPTRRAILMRLADQRALSVSELAEPFDIKLPAVMKHLDVLDDAGLIRRSKTGRTVTVKIAAGSLRPARDWLERREQFWTASLDRLVDYAEAKERAAKEKRR